MKSALWPYPSFQMKPCVCSSQTQGLGRMSRYETRTWQADPTVPGARSERQSFRYRAFVADPIADLQPTMSAATATRVSEAERLVDALNRDPPSMARLEVLARRLLRAESVASSRIEGLSLSQRRL